MFLDVVVVELVWFFKWLYFDSLILKMLNLVRFGVVIVYCYFKKKRKKNRICIIYIVGLN